MSEKSKHFGFIDQGEIEDAKREKPSIPAEAQLADLRAKLDAAEKERDRLQTRVWSIEDEVIGPYNEGLEKRAQAAEERAEAEHHAATQQKQWRDEAEALLARYRGALTQVIDSRPCGHPPALTASLAESRDCPCCIARSALSNSNEQEGT